MKIKIHPGLDHITDRADLLQDFVVFVCKDLQCMPCPIDIVNGREGAGLKTTAQYDPNNHHVMVNAKNRHFGDVLRSVAHELVHHKQNVKGELNGPVQDVGGDIEDEANARAGALLKSFAYQEGPERIYESPQEKLSAFVKLLCEQKSKKTTGDGDCEVPDYFWDKPGGIRSPVPGFKPPTSGEGSYRYSRGKGRKHQGIDFRSGPAGKIVAGETKVFAVLNGEVEKVGNDPDGYGHYIVIKHCLMLPKEVEDAHLEPSDHAGTLFTVYGHLHQKPSFSKGDPIKYGQEIGRAGVSGNATSKSGVETPQVHFEVLVATDPNDNFTTVKNNDVNPLKFDVSQAFFPGFADEESGKISMTRIAGDYVRAFDALKDMGFNIEDKKKKKKKPKPVTDQQVEAELKKVRLAAKAMLKLLTDRDARIAGIKAVQAFNTAFRNIPSVVVSNELKLKILQEIQKPENIKILIEGAFDLKKFIDDLKGN